jgi:hypothetical protein
VPSLALWDVDDAVGFVSAIVTRSGLSLSWSDREDLEQFLLVQAWELSLVYDTGDPKYPPRFAVYATNILRKRVVDWQRKRYRTIWKFKGRVYERPQPQLVSFDGDDAERDRLEQDLARGSLDRDQLGFPDELRVLEARGRRPGGREAWMGDQAAR